jgi:hypothetical protein
MDSFCGSLDGAGGFGSFGGGLSIYSQDAMNTTTVPGRTRKPRLVPKSIGEIYSKIPVAKAVAKHLMTASASI